MLGVISYLPDDLELRKMRLAMIEKALENNRTLFENEKTKIVVAQNFTEEELKLYEGFTIIEEKPLGAAKARNIILDIFEASEEHFLWIMDDDIMFYDYYGFGKLVKDFQENEGLHKVDVVTFFDPRMAGFRNILDSQDVKNFIYFIRQGTMNTSTGAFLIRNSRLAGKKSIRFIENYRELKIREDIAFLLDNIKAGKRLNSCPLVIYKWDSSDKGTIEQNKSSQQWIFQLEAHALQFGLAKMYGLDVNPINGNIDFGRFRKYLSRTSKSFRVERIYKLSDEDVQFKRKRVYGKSTKKIIDVLDRGTGLIGSKKVQNENSNANAIIDDGE